MTIKGHYVATFLGQCKGIGLRPRGDSDPHVCLVLLTHDDGHWFPSKQGFSSFWLDDLAAQLDAAKRWIEANCEPDVKDGKQWGWKFRG